jgi:protocatechuate 3,4-dioxygenase alpha subunit
VATDGGGRYAIYSVYPGRVAGSDGKPQAPHILVVLFARGLLAQVVTRIYFDGEKSNQDDPVLAQCGPRAGTLIARHDPADADGYVWNVSLQGANETVFFDA